MQILLFYRTVFPQERFVSNLISCLCEDLEAHHGARVTTVCGDLRLGRFLNSVLYFLYAMLSGWRGKRPQLVVSIADAPSAALPAWFWARLRRARFLLLSQEVFPQTAVLLGRFRNKIAFEILDWIGWFLLYAADVIVVPAEAIRRSLVTVKRADAAKIHVIHNGVDTSAIAPAPSDNDFRRKNELSNQFVVMHSGYVGIAQNLPTLLQAASLLRDIPQIRIVIVGDGNGRADLEKQAASLKLNNVLFLPFQLRASFPESLAAADVFVISMKEGMSGYIVPSRLYDVLAAGRTYVAALDPDSDAVQITNKYECGLLARPGDAQDLADKLLEFYYNREWLTWRANNARTAAVEYDRKHQAEKYAALFERLG